MKKMILLFCAALLFSSPIVTSAAEDGVKEVSMKSEESPESDSKAGNFMRGITLWKNNCARCHGMRDPKDFNDFQWEVIMAHMKVRAGLPGQDVRDILKFLQQSND